MPQYLPGFLLIFAVAFLIALGVTPIALRAGRRLDVQDRPGRTTQTPGRRPRTGGAAMYAGFTVAVLLTLLLPKGLFPPRLDPGELTRLAGLLIGVTAIFVFGLVDDRLELTSNQQYVGQFLSALLGLAFTIWIQKVNNPFTNEATRLPLARRGRADDLLVHGDDEHRQLAGRAGRAGGRRLVHRVAAFICFHMVREGQLSVALLPLALVGATLGFLPYNFNPAKIFMGSGGSYFLGWAVAALGIIGGAKVATVLLAMGLPILDVAWLIYNRWRNHGRLTHNGRDHLHHRLLDIGFTQRQIVLSYYAFCAIFGALAALLENRLYKLIALAVSERGRVRRPRLGSAAAGREVRQRASKRPEARSLGLWLPARLCAPEPPTHLPASP